METFLDETIGDEAVAFPITQLSGESLAVTLPEAFFRRCIEVAAEVERKANEIVVADADSAQVAAAFVGKIKLTQKRADAILGEPKSALNDARAKIIDCEKAIAAKLGNATRCANGKIMRWREQQRRKAEAAAAHIRAEYKAAGNDESALPPSLAVAAPRVAGIHERKGQWKGELTDIMAVVKFVAANPAHVGILSINQSALNALARATQGNLVIPGIRFTQEAGTVVNRALRTA